MNSYPSELLDKLTLAARRFARWGRHRKLAQWFWRYSLRYQYRWGRPNGPVASVFSRSLGVGLVSPEKRAASVASLVELYFSLVDDLGVERFVEAGAKEAAASQRALRANSGRDVVAFEANPFTFRRFEKQLQQTGVDYRHLALSDSPGPLTFQVRLTPDGKPIADGQGSMYVRSSYEPGYHEAIVDAVTLDDFFAQRDGGAVGPARCAWWVDVEGAAAPVLRGGVALLGVTDLVMIEVEDIHAWDQQEWLGADVVEFMVRQGFVPIARDAQSRHQFNIVFLRSVLSDSAAVERRLATWRSAC